MLKRLPSVVEVSSSESALAVTIDVVPEVTTKPGNRITLNYPLAFHWLKDEDHAGTTIATCCGDEKN